MARYDLKTSADYSTSFGVATVALALASSAFALWIFRYRRGLEFLDVTQTQSSTLAENHRDSNEDSDPPGNDTDSPDREGLLTSPASACGSRLLDIEDLLGKSLIPQTLRQIKQDGLKPYDAVEKQEKVRYLENIKSVPNFASHVKKSGGSLTRTHANVLQLNIGFYCNQACSHCHVDSSPLRKEMMSRDVADKCVDIARNSPSIDTIDLTGGAPELNREFRRLVVAFRALGLKVIDRCNLTVLLEPRQQDLPRFLAENKVHVIASLPCYLESNVAAQRGDQVFQRSILALRILNAAGYGKPETGLELDLVYNPTNLALPPSREKLISKYKEVLWREYGITFNNLHCITNMPINRFFDYLKGRGELEKYMDILVSNFHANTLANVMCRSYVSIDPHGYIFDCDFNQQLDLHLGKPGLKRKGLHVFDIHSTDDILNVKIVTKKHCYGCTAGIGSS